MASPWALGYMALTSAPIAYVSKGFYMHGARPFEMLSNKDYQRKIYPSPNWHIMELGGGENSLRKMYEEKNEEFYRKRDESKV